MGKHKRAKPKIVAGAGDPCPRCGQPTEIREHVQITARELRRPFYYSRWFNCTNPRCQTTLIMPSRFIVWNDNGRAAALRRLYERENLQRYARPEPPPFDDVVMQTLDELRPADELPPWDGVTPPWE